MADRYHRRGIWYREIRSAELCYVAPGFYEEGVIIQPTICIPDEALPALITVLDELGYIKPRLDERLRAEDLKITHRVLDLLDRVTTDLGLAVQEALTPLPDIVEEVPDDLARR